MYLKAQEGEETHYGQALFPVPSADPNDPLQWPVYKKHMILFICCLFSFLGISALMGPATYIGPWSAEFGVDNNTAAGLINYPNLVFGFGSLVLIPGYRKFGRRPTMLVSLVLYTAGLIWASQATTYSGLMAARIVHGFGSGVCEALPVQLVNDIFFIHERGKKLGWYTIALCLGATGPMFCGFMLAGGLSWHLFFYVEMAFALATLVLAFFFVEESSYRRKPSIVAGPPPASPTTETSDGAVAVTQVETNTSKSESRPKEYASKQVSSESIPPRKTLLQQLALYSKSAYVPEEPFFLMMARCFTYLLVPSTLWVIATYGIYIVCGFAFNFVFPLKIVAPPYNWPQTTMGLFAISSFVGFGLALPFLPWSDRLAARLTKRNNGVREAEMRLGVMLPAMVIAPMGAILFGLTAQFDLHWMLYMVGIALTQWSGYFYFTITLAYAVDSYTANLSEMLMIMNISKQAVSFGLTVEVLNWITKHGYAVVICGIFTAVLVVNNLMAVVFMIWGKKIRTVTSRSWLARMHAGTVIAGESH